MMMQNSRSTAMPISSTANTWAPNWLSMCAPRRPITAPMKKEVTATIGRASSPARSARATKGAQRKRRGSAISRPQAARMRPVKARVSNPSQARLTMPRPSRSRNRVQPETLGGVGSSACSEAWTPSPAGAGFPAGLERALGAVDVDEPDDGEGAGGVAAPLAGQVQNLGPALGDGGAQPLGRAAQRPGGPVAGQHRPQTTVSLEEFEVCGLFHTRRRVRFRHCNASP